jgi:hypothetical protein
MKGKSLINLYYFPREAAKKGQNRLKNKNSPCSFPVIRQEQGKNSEKPAMVAAGMGLPVIDGAVGSAAQAWVLPPTN